MRVWVCEECGHVWPLRPDLRPDRDGLGRILCDLCITETPYPAVRSVLTEPNVPLLRNTADLSTWRRP